MKDIRERVRARAEARKNAGGMSLLALPDGVELHKPEKGKQVFDVLPYTVTSKGHPEVKPGEQWFQRTYWAHFNVGPTQAAVVCPRTVNKACPICELHAKMRRDPDADEDAANALRAKERELFNIVLRGERDVKVLDISYHNFGKLLEQEVREGDESNAAFADAGADGKTLRVRWDEASAGGGHKFLEASRIDFLEREEALSAKLLAKALDLDELLKVHTYEEVKALLEGDEATGEKDADEDDDKPADKDEEEAEEEEKEDDEADEDACTACEGSGKTSKGKRCPICSGTGKKEADEDDDEEDDDDDGADLTGKGGKKPPAKDDDDEEDEEEDPPPKDKAAKKDPLDDWDDDEDDEEDAPPKKGKGKKADDDEEDDDAEDDDEPPRKMTRGRG